MRSHIESHTDQYDVSGAWPRSTATLCAMDKIWALHTKCRIPNDTQSFGYLSRLLLIKKRSLCSTTVQKGHHFGAVVILSWTTYHEQWGMPVDHIEYAAVEHSVYSEKWDTIVRRSCTSGPSGRRDQSEKSRSAPERDAGCTAADLQRALVSLLYSKL